MICPCYKKVQQVRKCCYESDYFFTYSTHTYKQNSPIYKTPKVYINKQTNKLKQNVRKLKKKPNRKQYNSNGSTISSKKTKD